MDQLTLEEQRHAGGAAAHVDDGGAKLPLVVHQRRQSGGHRCRNQIASISRSQRANKLRASAALWRRHRSRAAARECLAIQTARIDDLVGLIQRERQRHGVDRLAAFGGGSARPSLSTRRMSCSFTARPPTGHFTLYIREVRLAAREVDDDRAQSRVRHVLGLADAARIARSAVSRSTMLPPRTPRP